MKEFHRLGELRPVLLKLLVLGVTGLFIFSKQCGAQALKNYPSTSFEMAKELYGVVRSESVANDIARALVRGQYGEHEVKRQEPFHAKRDGNNWEVTGSATPKLVPQNPDGSITLNADSNGPAKVVISAKTGEILDFVIARHLPTAWPGPATTP